MKKIISFVLLNLLFAPISAFATPLVDAQWIEDFQGHSIVLVDVRSAEAFAKQHIPNSVNAPYGKFGWRQTVDGVIGKLPPLDVINGKIASLGITTNDYVVVIPESKNSSSIGSGIRVYWTLKVLGHRNVSLLDGGFQSWLDNDLSTESGAVEPPFAYVSYPGKINKKLLATRDELQSNIDEYAFIDARPTAQHEGYEKHPKAEFGGALPNSGRLPEKELFQADSLTFKNKEEILAVAKKYDLALGTGKSQVSYCNTGHWAATSWFALSEIVGEQVALYDGSWVEWAALPSSPVENKKNGVQLFWYNLTK